MTGWQARVGDELAVESHRLGGARRAGTVVQVLGSPGHVYYRVRWRDGRETLVHPGPDLVLLTPHELPARAAAPSRRRPSPATPPKGSPAAGAARPRLAAAVGDRLVIRGHQLGRPERDAEILEVLGRDGGPPYRVRWTDTGREGILYPGPDAAVEHVPKARRARRRST